MVKIDHQGAYLIGALPHHYRPDHRAPEAIGAVICWRAGFLFEVTCFDAASGDASV
jgi:hypothetical protein